MMPLEALLELLERVGASRDAAALMSEEELSRWPARQRRRDGTANPMRKRRPNYRLVKIHRSYTVEEIARLFGTHKNTVRAWVKAGLPTCDGKRPILILGSELAGYLKARRTRNKRPCQPGEIYCVRCRVPKKPAGDMAEYQPITATLGNLMGICPDCEGMIFRRASFEKLDLIRAKLNVTIVEARRQVNESNSPTVNSDFRQG